MRRTPSALVAALALAAATLAGCTADGGAAEAEAPAASPATAEPSIDEVAVTYVTAPLNVPSIVEREIGALAEAFGGGVEVTYSELTTGPEQTAALASGDIQFLFAVGATSVIMSAANGADIAIVDTYSRSPEAFMLVTGPDGPTTPAELAGRTVAGPKGTILHELLLAYLASGGLTADDVNLVDMKIPDAQAALAGGSVDVALLAGPAAATMLADGFTKVTDGTDLVGATIVVATSRTFADEHPDVVRTFVDAHRAVLAYMDENPDEVIEMTAAETGLPVEAVREMYPMYDFGWEVTDADLAAMEATQDFMLANEMITERIDIPSLVLDLD